MPAARQRARSSDSSTPRARQRINSLAARYALGQPPCTLRALHPCLRPCGSALSARGAGLTPRRYLTSPPDRPATPAAQATASAASAAPARSQRRTSSGPLTPSRAHIAASEPRGDARRRTTVRFSSGKRTPSRPQHAAPVAKATPGRPLDGLVDRVARLDPQAGAVRVVSPPSPTEPPQRVT